jgi:hypothetical protein
MVEILYMKSVIFELRRMKINVSGNELMKQLRYLGFSII